MQTCAPLGIDSVDQIRSYVDYLRRRCSCCTSCDLVKLVPRQQFIRSDVERFADGAVVAQQAIEPLGEVAVVGEDPQRRSIAVNDHLLAFSHAVDYRPAAGKRQHRFVVGVRWPYNGERELFFTICTNESFFTGDLVAGVLPVRIVERCRLSHRQIYRWGLVCRCRADEHVLVGATTEKFEICFDVVGSERYEVHHGIELVISHRRTR